MNRYSIYSSIVLWIAKLFGYRPIWDIKKMSIDEVSLMPDGRYEVGGTIEKAVLSKFVRDKKKERKI